MRHLPSSATPSGFSIIVKHTITEAAVDFVDNRLCYCIAYALLLPEFIDRHLERNRHRCVDAKCYYTKEAVQECLLIFYYIVLTVSDVTLSSILLFPTGINPYNRW